MCGCNSGGARNLNRSAPKSKKPKVEIMPLEWYKGLDTSGWKPAERALVRSQINIYPMRGDIYYETIRNLKEHYSP